MPYFSVLGMLKYIWYSSWATNYRFSAFGYTEELDVASVEDFDVSSLSCFGFDKCTILDFAFESITWLFELISYTVTVKNYHLFCSITKQQYEENGPNCSCSIGGQKVMKARANFITSFFFVLLQQQLHLVFRTYQKGHWAVFDTFKMILML